MRLPVNYFCPWLAYRNFFIGKKDPKIFPSFQPTSKQIAFMHVWPRHTILSILRKWTYFMPSPTISRPLKHLSCVNLEVSGIMKTGIPRCWLFLYLWPPHILHTPRFPPHPFSRYLTWWTEYRRESHSGNSPSSIKQKALVSIMEKRQNRTERKILVYHVPYSESGEMGSGFGRFWVPNRWSDWWWIIFVAFHTSCLSTSGLD